MEREILQNAIEALTARSGLQAEIVHLPGSDTERGQDGGWDQILEVRANGHRHRFAVVVKRGLTKSGAGVLLHQIRDEDPLPVLVVSERVPPPVAELLRTQGRCYLDATGNGYLHHGPLFVLIEGRRQKKAIKPEPVRAFQDAGLRLIFLLLLDAEKASCTYRDLAGLVGISRGAIGYVMADLTALDYLVETGSGRRKVLKHEALIEKWVTGYGETLRPKLVRGRFRFKDAEQRRHWREIPLASTGSLWGGEPAADLLTNYLRPEVYTLYTDASTLDLVRATKLLPDPDGPIDVLRPFWRQEAIAPYLPALEPPSAPPLLVYADLVASAASRNLETARMLYEQKLAV